MFQSLYSKIAAGLAGLFLLVGLVFIGVTVFSTDMYQQEINQKLNINLAKQIVKERLLMEEGRINRDALKEIFHMLMVINPGIEIYLLDTSGEILAFSAPPGSVKRQQVDLGPLKEWLTGNTAAPVRGDDPKSLTGKKVFSAARIERQGIHEGYLYVILGGEQYDSVAEKLKSSYILQLSAWMMAAGLLFALIAGLLLFAMLTGRLRRLARVMDGFKPGENISLAPIGPPNTARDEIDRLSGTFRQMAGRIETQMAQLKASDKMRRELVANVSHDLRTPLATLQGYIETLLLKENRYSMQERRQYLETAIKHCHRLNRLVTDLLDIARFESAQVPVKQEAFHLAELVSDVMQKFALSAREKQVELVPAFSASLPFVNADIALIERVMENLVENALHHTPAKGRVTIELSWDGDIMIAVRDTGPGIPPKDLPHIFDRFYHAGKNGRKDPAHSGLGLAITKKIIELHDREISVDSRAGRGACFSFSLPVA